MSTLLLKQEDIHRGSLILVNREHGYREAAGDGLIPAYYGCPQILLRHRAVVLLSSLMEELRGWRSIAPVSGYRTLEEQKQIWDDSLEENGREFTEKFVAFPGHSEHQTGLAIDLALKRDRIDFICPDFPYNGICQTLRERAADYGFVERYPAGKESVTGIGHEPWHFRYVGVPHAVIMQENGLVLEEYMDFIKQYVYGKRPYVYEGGQAVEVSYVSAAEKTELEIDLKKPYCISGNNADGYVITQWLTQGACRERRKGA